MLVKSFVLCEQIRQENTGKFMLLGIFGTDVVVNNMPADTRWQNPLFFSALFALKIDRETDAGFYSVKTETENGTVLSSELTIEIKRDGASYIQLPMNLALQLKGPSEVQIHIYKKDSLELVAEVGRFSVQNAE